MKLFHFILFIFAEIPMSCQTNEFYDISQAILTPTEVESLYLNYNFQEIKPLPSSIDKFTNLREFRIQARMFYCPQIDVNKIFTAKMDSLSPTSPTALPSTITNCLKLKLIDISNSDISFLPQDLDKLQGLETLILNNSDIDLNKEIDKILKLNNLIELQILNLDYDETTMNKLNNLADVRILKKIEDWEECYPIDSASHIQFHDTYIVFKNHAEAERFVHSIPNLARENAPIFKR